MKVLIRFTTALLLTLASLQSWAVIDYTDEQRETIIEMIEQ